MKVELKFREVVERGQLDGNTAQYVLKRPDYLAGMPNAGAKGAHRRFNLRQAMKLAVTTHLVKLGVKLSRAASIAQWCESAIKGQSRPKTVGENRYRSSPTDPWTLRVVDERFVRLWRAQIEADSHLIEEDDFYDIEQESMVNSPDELTHVQINLTTLELRLASVSSSK